jgi:peptide/nickel transport system ATP-binding protein
MNELEVLLEISNLSVKFETDFDVVQALSNLSLTIYKGKTLGVLGESGAGKTTMARSIMRLIPSPPGKITNGEIIFEGQDILSIPEAQMRKIRGKRISMVFQDPMTSLNPVMTVVDQVAEVVRNHERVSRREAHLKAIEMLSIVGIDSERAGEYPHQFSGGMRQRVVIAIALVCRPELLIADEPTTALDVTIQAQVLEMIKRLQKEFSMTQILITHDLGVAAQNCDFAAVVYAGELVEYGTIRDIFRRKCHPYTQGLFDSIPKLGVNEVRLKPIRGLVPDPTKLPKGCKFQKRCLYSTDECVDIRPDLQVVEGYHLVRCNHWQEVSKNV